MKKFKVGIQLYGLRDYMERDMDATLKVVKEMGYDFVEFAGYFDKTPDEVGELLKKHGLEGTSIHRGYNFFEDNFDTEIDYLKKMGAKYAALPSYPIDEFFNNFDGTMKRFTELGENLKANGIQLLYHNHDFEFQKIDGEAILGKMYKTVPQECLQPEFDLCWVHYAGLNPAEYIMDYAGRMDIVHFKDFVCEKLGGGLVYELIDTDNSDNKVTDKDEVGFKFKPVGYGIQDWDSIVDACEKCGVKYIVVEQDQWYDDDAMECARMSRNFLKEKYGI